MYSCWESCLGKRRASQTASLKWSVQISVGHGHEKWNPSLLSRTVWVGLSESDHSQFLRYVHKSPSSTSITVRYFQVLEDKAWRRQVLRSDRPGSLERLGISGKFFLVCQEFTVIIKSKQGCKYRSSRNTSSAQDTVDSPLGTNN
jgi:hypothetical protein